MAIEYIYHMSRSNKMTGSGSIGSGGYGCVFLPALSCETNINDDTNQHDKYVTKLMTNENANTEYRLIRSFDKRLGVIPNYTNYFLVSDISKCRPAPLTRRDMHAYDKQCKPLTKKNITRKNINQSLHKITAIHIPYGGDTIDDYWMSHINNRGEMETMIASMHALLIRGIIPMNHLGIHHGDIKSSNILYYKGKSKLIDWGLAFDTSYKSDHNIDGISRLATYRPFQFNILPSCVLLNNEFITSVASLLKTNSDPDRQTINDFVAGFINDWNKIRGEGSISLLVTLYDKLVPYAAKQSNIEHAIATGPYMNSVKDASIPSFAVNYIANILIKYIWDGEFHLDKYYKEIYLKNIDIWGFAISFMILFNLLCKNESTLNQNEKKSVASLCNMYIHVLEMDSEPINIEYIARCIKEVHVNYQS